MITLITGQPGAGKTLHTLWLVKAFAEKEARPVFYSGIPGLNTQVVPWEELKDPDDWPKLQAGAIIVIDECQRIYRPRGNGSKVPESVAAMETHRHHGFDIFLITQHPMLLDSNIRRLVGRHIHLMRAFGGNAANVHEWQETRENCDKQRNGSQSKFWPYPKEVFEYYKSAELHTHRFRPPLRAVLLLLGPILFGVLVWFAVSWFSNKGKTPLASTSTVTAASPSPGQKPDYLDRHAKPATATEWMESYTPRLPGFVHTAPAYDEVTIPVAAPAPVGCSKTARSCQCYTEQGTIVPTTTDICGQLVKDGFFRAWEGKERVTHANR